MVSIDRFIFLLIVAVVVIMLLPTLNYNLPEAMIGCIVAIAMLVCKPSIIVSASFLCWSLYFLLHLLDIGNPNASMQMQMMVFIFAFLFIWSAGKRYITEQDHYRILRIIFYCIFITVVISLFFSIQYPNIVRESLDIENGSPESSFAEFGLMSYGFGHALPVIFPLMIVLGKRKKTFFNQYYILTLFGLLLLFIAGISTSAFLSIILVILAFIIPEKKNNNRLLIYVAIFSALFMLFGSAIISEFLTAITPLFDGFVIQNKIVEIQQYFATGISGDEIEARGMLYAKSWNTFFENPLLGCRDWNQVGAHTFIGDSLAYWGILGFLPFILFVIAESKYILRRIDRTLRPFYLLSVLYVVALSFYKGSMLIEVLLFLFFILPIFLIEASKKTDVLQKSL